MLEEDGAVSEVGGTRETELDPQGNRGNLDQDASLGPGVIMAGEVGSASTLERCIFRQCLKPGICEPSLKDHPHQPRARGTA